MTPEDDKHRIIELLNDILDEDGRHPVTVERIAREMSMSESKVRLRLAGLHNSGKVICHAKIGNTLIAWCNEVEHIQYATLCRER